MLITLFRPALAGIAVLAAAAPAASAAEVLSSRVAAPETAEAVRCQDGPAKGDGIVTKRVRMPADGLVLARLSAGRGDWDLAVFDAASRELVGASSGFNSVEVAEGFAGGGRTLLVQACRVSGGARSARVNVTTVPLPKRDGRVERAQVVKVSTPTRKDKERLTRIGLDLTEHAGHDFVEAVLYGARDEQRLRGAGFTWEVEIADLDRRARANARRNAEFASGRAASSLPSGRDSYRHLADYEADMKRLAAEHPGLVRPITLPERTVEGRQVFGIEVSDGVQAADDGKPTFVMLGLHHAREWPSGEHTMEFAIDLVNGFGSDPRITGLLQRARVVFVPVVNPDGFNVSREAAVDLGDAGTELGGQTGYAVVSLADPFVAYKRRNCRILAPLPSAPGLCALPAFRFTGVDLNRNYGALWGGPGASALPLYDTYRGSAPFSEPETRNVQALVSGRQVTTLITNHTFSNLVLRPPGVQAQGLPPDEEAMKALGDAMAAENGYTSQPGYGLYDTTGTTEDWSYNATGGYGYTFEIGPDEFHPPFEQVVAEYRGTAPAASGGGGNREAYLLALENAADPAHHSLLRGRAPAGTVLRLKKSFLTETSPVRPAETDIAGDPTGIEGGRQTVEDTLDTTLTVGPSNTFEWHVNPSTRPAVQDRRFPETGELRKETFQNAPGEVSQPAQSSFDREFTVREGEEADQLVVELDWPTPDDYDLEVYRREADGSLTDVGGSGNPPGDKETATIDAPVPATYVLRVVNFAAVSQEWTMTATLLGQTGVRTEPGSGPEAWTLTCETGEGAVVSRRELFVARGEALDLGQACGPELIAPFSVTERSARSVRISRRSRRASRRGAISVPVSYPRATAPDRCSGILALTHRRRVRGRVRIFTLGRKRYSIAAGERRVVRVKIRRASRRYIRTRRTIRVRAIALPSGDDAIRRAVNIRVRGTLARRGRR